MSESLVKIAEMKRIREERDKIYNKVSNSAEPEVKKMIENINDYITNNDKYKFELLDSKIENVLKQINDMNAQLNNLTFSVESTKQKPKKIISSK